MLLLTLEPTHLTILLPSTVDFFGIVGVACTFGVLDVFGVQGVVGVLDVVCVQGVFGVLDVFGVQGVIRTCILSSHWLSSKMSEGWQVVELERMASATIVGVRGNNHLEGENRRLGVSETVESRGHTGTFNSVNLGILPAARRDSTKEDRLSGLTREAPGACVDLLRLQRPNLLREQQPNLLATETASPSDVPVLKSRIAQEFMNRSSPPEAISPSSATNS